MNISRTTILCLVMMMVSSRIGDYKPLCYFPEFFTTSIQPVNAHLDVDKY